MFIIVVFIYFFNFGRSIGFSFKYLLKNIPFESMFSEGISVIKLNYSLYKIALHIHFLIYFFFIFWVRFIYYFFLCVIFYLLYKKILFNKICNVK